MEKRSEVTMLRWLSGSTLVLLAACSRSSDDPPVVRLVDVFDETSIEGSAREGEPPPRTEWRFDGGSQGFATLTGVAGLEVRNGRLRGRAATELPMLQVERTEGLDDPDTLHAVEVRLWASKGANLSMTLVGPEGIELEALTQGARRGGWELTSPMLPSEQAQTYTLGTSRSVASSSIRHVVLRPTDEAGAEFAIESVRLIFRREQAFPRA